MASFPLVCCLTPRADVSCMDANINNDSSGIVARFRILYSLNLALIPSFCCYLLQGKEEERRRERKKKSIRIKETLYEYLSVEEYKYMYV